MLLNIMVAIQVYLGLGTYHLILREGGMFFSTKPEFFLTRNKNQIFYWTQKMFFIQIV